MASTVLEQTRALHEDIEILEKTMYGELGDASATKLKRADEVARDQVVSTVLGAHTSKCAELTAIYEDADGARRDEVNAMSGTGVFTAFYDQLKGIREYHRKFPREPAMESYESELLGALLTRDDPTLAFSGEEAEGKYVDMHGCHEMYLNLKGADHLDYAAYLQRCRLRGLTCLWPGLPCRSRRRPPWPRTPLRQAAQSAAAALGPRPKARGTDPAPPSSFDPQVASSPPSTSRSLARRSTAAT